MFSPIAVAVLGSGCTAGPSWTVPADPSTPAPPTPTTPGDDDDDDDTTPEEPEAPTLVALPPGGLYDAPVWVVLVSDDPEAEILYTVDGTVPVAGVASVYDDPIALATSAIVRATVTNDVGTTEIAPAFLQMELPFTEYSSNVPQVVLWSLDVAPTAKSELYTTFSVSTFEPPVGGRVTFPTDATLSVRAGLKVRGSSTAYYEKLPYRLEAWTPTLDEDMDIALLGMPEEADWVLGAPYDFDRALIRDPLIFALSNSIGRYASRTRFVELFVAETGETVGLDDYVGVYVVTERIERDADRVALTELEPTDLVEPELTGGYLFKEDRPGPGELGFYAGTADGAFVFQQPWVYVDPAEDEIAAEQQAYLSAQLDELAVALASPGFVNPTTGRHYDTIIDVDAWIDHHLLNVYAKNPDALRLSAYFHKDREGPIAAGPIWDFDRTMGCSSDDRAGDPTWWDATNQTSDTTAMFDHGLWRGLFSDPEFRDQYWARLDGLLANELSVATVEAVIDGMAAELDEPAVRNITRWPAVAPRGGSFAAEVDLLSGWLAARHAWMTGCLALPDPRTCVGG